MDAVKDSLADYWELWGGTREYIDYKWAFLQEFDDEPPAGADDPKAGDEWLVATPEEREGWPDKVRRRWEQYHLGKAESLGFKITIEELDWETSWLFTKRRIERCREKMERDPELSAKEAMRHLLLEHLKEVAQRPDYFADCGEEKYMRILGEMGINKIE